MKKLHFEPGDVICHEGDAADGVYIVVAGKVEVLTAIEGKELVRVETYGPGKLFGDIAVTKDIPRLATVRAIESTILSIIPKEIFLDRFKDAVDDTWQEEAFSETRDDTLQSKRLFIVDDDALLVKLLTHNLSQRGAEVQSASDGEEALDLIRTKPPDLILLDGMMPAMDGMEVLQRLKQWEETRKIPIIMISARGHERDIVAGFRMGAEDYVVKPFMMEELFARVQKALRTRLVSTQSKSTLLLA